MRKDELNHAGVRGMKWGRSTDPNYTPIGRPAQGPAWMPGSSANRQYRANQQQQARLAADEALKRAKESASSTVNSGVNAINSAASRAAQLAEDAKIRKDLARREREKKHEQARQERQQRISSGVENLKSSLTSTANSALKNTPLRLTRGKRGVTNPYEQGYTGRTHAQATRTERQKDLQERIKRDTKAGKYGVLAAAKVYGKDGLSAASRIAKAAKNLPRNARSEYYKKKNEISRNLDDFKREVTASDAYKKTKKNVTKAAAAAKTISDKAPKSAQKAQKKASELYARSKPELDEAKTRVKEKASEAATAVGAEADRLKKKGLSLLKKLRK